MKLAELISEEKIIIREEAPVQALTSQSLNGIDYIWKNGKYVNAKDNSPAPKNINKKLIASSNKINQMHFSKKGSVVYKPVQVGNRHIVNLAGESYSFTKSADAKKFMSNLASGKSTQASLSKIDPKNVKKIGTNVLSKINLGRVMSDAEIKVAKARSQSATRLLQNTKLLAFFKFLGVLGISAQLFQSMIINYDTVRNEPITDDFTQDDKEELLAVIEGLWVTQTVVILLAVFRIVKVGRLITLLRAPIRAFQAGAAATGVGFVPSLISMIVTEAAFWGATYLLTRPAVQMKLADWLAGSSVDWLFEGIGNTVDLASQALEKITNGAFGGPTLRDALSFEKGVKKMPTGTAYASSEWAKLAFQDMIFPPDMEKIKVPYYVMSDRSKGIYDALDIDPTQRPSNTIQAREVSRNELGGLSDYVFNYTPELADELKDTHEIVVVNDQAGARPGGSNSIYYLMPSAKALKDFQEGTITTLPQPDNRTVTRQGQPIEREPQQDPTQDPIVNIANDAINSVPDNRPGPQ